MSAAIVKHDTRHLESLQRLVTRTPPHLGLSFITSKLINRPQPFFSLYITRGKRNPEPALSFIEIAAVHKSKTQTAGGEIGPLRVFRQGRPL